MCIYVYLFSVNIFNISPFKKITSFTGFVLFISISLCFLFFPRKKNNFSLNFKTSFWYLSGAFLDFFFFPPFFCLAPKNPSYTENMYNKKKADLRKSLPLFKDVFKNIQISYLSSLFYYFIIFSVICHTRKLNARRRRRERRKVFYKLFQ